MKLGSAGEGHSGCGKVSAKRMYDGVTFGLAGSAGLIGDFGGGLLSAAVIQTPRASPNSFV